MCQFNRNQEFLQKGYNILQVSHSVPSDDFKFYTLVILSISRYLEHFINSLYIWYPQIQGTQRSLPTLPLMVFPFVKFYLQNYS